MLPDRSKEEKAVGSEVIEVIPVSRTEFALYGKRKTDYQNFEHIYDVLKLVVSSYQ